MGNAEVGKLLREVYMPILLDEKERSQKAKGTEDYQRAKLLENFARITEKFLKELSGSAI